MLIRAIFALSIVCSTLVAGANAPGVIDLPPVLIIDGDLVAWESAHRLPAKPLTRAHILKQTDWLTTLAMTFLTNKLIHQGDIPPFNLQHASSQIGFERIQAYYTQHPQRFSSVSQVSARHIHLNTAAQATRVFQNLQNQANFTEQVQHFSLAEDKHQPDPGRLPDIHVPSQGEKPLSLLEKICLFQIPGKISRPIKINAGWEIILVDTRLETQRAIQDPALRREIARIIARSDRDQWVKQSVLKAIQRAQIQINPAFLTHPN